MEFLFGIDLVTLLKTAGYAGLTFIVFAESGILFGFFLPGDSLLFTAGFLASQGFFSLPVLYVLCFLAAVLGDSVGYAFGARVGPALFTREDSLLFHKEHLSHAAQFYHRHGAMTLVLARFMPVVRTFAPILAGVGKMPYRHFFFWNVLGGFLWSTGLLTLGFFLGSLIPDPDRYLLPAIALIIFFSFLPGLIGAFRHGVHRKVFAYIRTRF